jgi:kynureninase
LLASFYRPTQQKFKIIIESDAFPSDAYIVESQLRFHGYSVEEGLIKLAPREGQICLMTEDILAVLEREKDCLALVLLGGVNYYTGQVFDMETIAASCQQYQLPLGLDLAHATGNVVLQLHDWGVDFAAWCSYKYLNAGPGAVGGAFIHEKHHANPDMPRLAGWWGHNKETRFQMKHGFEPIPTAEGWQVSNAPIFSMAALRASMEIFDQAGMDALREKSVKLTGYLAFMLGQVLKPEEMEIITPNTPEQRGCQISLRVKKNGKKLHKKLTEKGVICDWREPDVIRLAPVPLYNSFMDIWDFGNVVQAALQSVK